MLLLWILFMCGFASAVDRGNFKSCDQSSFCKRNRAYFDTEEPHYFVVPESVEVMEADGKITGIISDTKTDVKLNFELMNLDGGNIRLKVIEKDSIHSRYTPQYALEGNPISHKVSLSKKTDQLLHCTLNPAVGLTVQYKPFQIEITRDGKPVILANSKRLFNFEHYRTKPEAPENHVVDNAEKDESHDPELPEHDMDPENDKPDHVDQGQFEDDQDGMWEEDFKSHQDSKPRGPSSIAMDVSFPGSSHVYGIPEHADSFALKDTGSGDPYRLYNLDVFEYEIGNPMALYGSVPFIVSHSLSHGTVGVFWHNAAETWVDIKSEPDSGIVSTVANYLGGNSEKIQKNVHWISESGALDIFLLTGPSPADVMKQYKGLTGTTQLPPLFSLGYHQCRWNYNDEQDVQFVHDSLDKHDIPFDVIWLDIEHTDGKKYFTWDSHKFSSPIDMVNKLTARGRKMVTIIDPHIKRDSNYFLHNDATNNGYYVKDRNDKDFDGWCWPGSSGYLDFFNPVVQDYWVSRFSLDNYQGSTLDLYTWNDMNEPSVFNGPEVTMHKDAHHHGGWEHRDVHNEYGMLVPMCSARGQLERSGGKLRPFVLTRAAFAGSQRFGAKWTGDNTAEWSHLEISIPMLLSSSIAGISFIGADIGGFFGNPDTELLTRWYQLAAFQPFVRAHAHIDTRRREPYLFDQTTIGLVRTAVRQRYRYLPLWYTLFYENELTGMPPMRPMWMEFPDDVNTYAIENEYMVGDALLVHPQTSQGGASVSVYFPTRPASVVWYDIDTLAVHAHGSVSVDTPMEKLPVFQRGGTIVPRQDRPRRSTAQMLHDPYTLVVALDKDRSATGTLYADDGASFEYRSAKHIYCRFTFRHGVLKSERISGAGYETSRWIERVIVVGVEDVPKQVLLKAAGREENLEFKINRELKRVVIRKPGVNIAEDWSIVVA